MNNRAFHKNRILVIHIELSKGDFNCGASSKADFILNYFLSKFLNFPKISSNFLSNSPLPPSPASAINGTLTPTPTNRS